MDKKINSLFSSQEGKRLFDMANSAIEEHNMADLLKNGVLLGLSGGADSVMLLCFLLEYRRKTSDFPILAVHVNHSIRAEDADADESFCNELCSALGVEFISRKIDVPTMASEQGIGVEECARNARYMEFANIISGRNDIKTIAVAHNADDNLETVIFNIFRGSGTRGAAGIPPVRENIVRPLIYLEKKEITKALNSFEIEFVTDKTNSEIEYRRNYIRHKIIPEIKNICDDPAAMATRLSKNLRLDDEYINIQADNIIRDNKTVSASVLAELHPALRARVITRLAKLSGAEISATQIEAISSLLNKNKFSYSLPGGARFVCESGECFVSLDGIDDCYDYFYKLSLGKNSIDEYDTDFFITEEKLDESCLNVYKIAIQVNLSSAIIGGDLYLRPRKEGDTIYYGGITRKIKKLFSDRKIPQSQRDSIPLLCDDKGVLWVPGFGVRDDGSKPERPKYATLAIGRGAEMIDKRMHSASEYK